MSMYTILEDNVRDIIINSLSEYPATSVIHSNSSGTEPTTSYCTVSKLRVSQKSKAQNSSMDEDFNSETAVNYEVQATISFIGSNSGNLAFSSHVRLNNTISNREFSQAKKLAVTSKSNVVSVPYLRGTKWVDVFSYDVSFNFIWGVLEEIQPILQVVIENADYSETITIPPQI